MGSNINAPCTLGDVHKHLSLYYITERLICKAIFIPKIFQNKLVTLFNTGVQCLNLGIAKDCNSCGDNNCGGDCTIKSIQVNIGAVCVKKGNFILLNNQFML